ncbi:MAG: hypothetical protein ACRDV7_05860, partial [Acidimicrobiia bacterium]
MPALALLGFGFVLAQPATAQDDVDTEPNGIEVAQVDGLLDPANAALLTRVVQKAEDDDATLLVVQLAGTGAVDTDVDELVDLFE